MARVLAILVLNLFAYLTIKFRPKIFNVELFKPMIWNFKLSLLPLILIVSNFSIFIGLSAIASIIGYIFIRYIAIILSVLVAFIWLLLLPNSSYLITELNLTHRNQDKNEVPIWYDIVSITSFALSGVLNTVLNINIIQIIFIIFKDPDTIDVRYRYLLFFSAIIINILVAIGVYLGRSIRFNSWDVLRPINFFKKIMDHFLEKGEKKNFILFVIFHSLFFQIIYCIFNFNDFLRR